MIFEICHEMHKVPNEACMQNMEPRTRQWLYYNIMEKRRKERLEYERRMGMSSLGAK